MSCCDSSFLPAWHRLDDVRHDWDGDEESRDVVKDEGGGGRVRGLEGAPHALAEVLQKVRRSSKIAIVRHAQTENLQSTFVQSFLRWPALENLFWDGKALDAGKFFWKPNALKS